MFALYANTLCDGGSRIRFSLSRARYRETLPATKRFPFLLLFHLDPYVMAR
jgi:hypothetical protein